MLFIKAVAILTNVGLEAVERRKVDLGAGSATLILWRRLRPIGVSISLLCFGQYKVCKAYP